MQGRPVEGPVSENKMIPIFYLGNAQNAKLQNAEKSHEMSNPIMLKITSKNVVFEVLLSLKQ